MKPTRRHFLQTTALATGAALLSTKPLSASIARSLTGLHADTANILAQRLDTNWEYFQGPMGGPWEIWHAENIAVFEKVTLPHCFNHYDACDPDTPYYRGHGWYRTHITAANPYKSGRTLLHFEGAGQTTEVFIGETSVGKHIGGYDEFVFDITDAASTAATKDGIPLSILCDNGRDLNRMPSDQSDFSLYGGLYRNVNLVHVPAISLEAAHIRTTVTGKAAEITVTARLYNPNGLTDAVEVTVSITDPDGKTIHTSSQKLAPWKDESKLTTFKFTTSHLWSPATPHLYRSTVTLKSDTGTSTLHERFGIRHFEFVEHGPFLLNGERLLLRGTQRHEDHANFASAMPEDLVREELKLVKEMGANFIRLGHYQQSRLVLELCDELGILVWEEIPWCRSGIGPDIFQQMGRRTLASMIDQHSNHPCVILWGLGNEDDWPGEYPSIDKDAIRAYMTELRELAHQLDPTRLTSFRRCDFARDIPDVYSPSIWAGWYSGTYPEYQASLEKERERVKRLIHIEWGADSHARRHSENPDKVLADIATGKGTDERGLAYKTTGGDARVSKDGDWSETYACNLFDWHLKVQETLPWLTGSAQWIFKDFTTPLRVENPVPRVNQKGLLERDMTKKEGYFVFQSYWSEKPMVRLYGHTWPIRWGEPNEEKMVKVYSNCEHAELFLNGRSLGTKKRDSQDFPCAGLRWMTPFLAGKNHLRVVAARGKTTVTDEIDFTYQTEKWTKPAAFQLTEGIRLTSDKATTVQVNALLVDANGTPCLDARHQVRFTISGPGVLQDNLGTSTGSRVVQLANGRTAISVSLKAGQRSTIAITADGLPTTFLALG